MSRSSLSKLNNVFITLNPINKTSQALSGVDNIMVQLSYIQESDAFSRMFYPIFSQELGEIYTERAIIFLNLRLSILERNVIKLS